jgi:hypothetical protein
MLGKVFENLLEVKDRKSKGTYYTPREIVHYMCQESLANYLSTELEGKVCKEEIETLIKYGESVVEHDSRVVNEGRETRDYSFKLPPSVRKHAQFIDEKLKIIRVCDPAVGSGAFPVGMMNEIIRTRNALTPYIGENGERSPYHFKRQAIQNCLYGVDIDPGAVEIAKLRLWLSLIVDEEDREKIQPLPNLDYKIMQGNSLLSEFMGIDFDKEDDNKNGKLLISQDDTGELIEKLKNKKDEYLNKAGAGEKQKLKQEIEDLMITIFETKLQKQKSDYFNRIKFIEEKCKIWPNKEQREKLIQQEKEKLSKDSGFNLEQFEKQLREYTTGNKIRPFFPWRLYFAEVFHEKKGFDVVIANPPYITYKGKQKIEFNKKEIEQYQKLYLNSAEYKINSFALFLERGAKLLSKSGILTYIIPSTFLQNEYLGKIRKYLLSNFNINKLITFGNKVFEAVTDSIILFVTRTHHKRKTIVIRKNDRDFSLDNKFLVFEQSRWLENNDGVIYIRSSPEIQKILEKIEKDIIYLDQYFEANIGIKRAQAPISDIPKKGYRKFLVGRNIGKYQISFDNKYILFETKYFHTSVDERIFLQPEKLLIRKTGDTLITAYDNQQYYTDQSIYNVYPKGKHTVNLKFLLGVLNSSLMNFYFKQKMVTNVDIYPYIKGIHLKKLPIKETGLTEQKFIIESVDNILVITKDDDYLKNPTKQAKVREYEKQIDQLVYKLYGLTDEEIKIVEGQNDDSKS